MMPTPTLTLITPATSETRFRWHRPLLWLAAVMVPLMLWAIVARFVDPREITGANAWDKPLKFALSTIIYSVTWSWLIGQLQRRRRVASVAGTVIAVTLFIELIIITGAAASGTTSHFNVETDVTTALWQIMGASIVVLWLATLVVAGLLFFSRFEDGARAVAVRSGAVIGIVGLSLGFLMTVPTAAQLAADLDIAGAHTVGMPDGGSGLPLLGWSTVAGDLRIPHFIGMHALQVLPLLLLLLELAARRVTVLQDVATRARLIWVAAGTYLAVVALVTWQALRAQSIVSPDALTLTVVAAILTIAASSVAVVLTAGRRRLASTSRA